MTRRCSHCSKDGHNSRTCISRSGGSGGCSSVASSGGICGGVKLFGVRLTDGSIIKKSASMGNLSMAHYHSSSSAAASPNPDSPLSEHVRDVNHADGYLSDDPAHGSGSGNRRSDRKKGVPWTEEEHRLFLTGLQQLGKGDWRGIARNYVVSRTPTQVASHAQKYFIRQTNSTRRKRRSSLFDMVPDLAADPLSIAEDDTMPQSSYAQEETNKDALPSLDLCLNNEYQPMEATTHVETITKTEDDLQSPSPYNPSENIPPLLPLSSDFTAIIPGFFPAYVPIVPYSFWPASEEETSAAGQSNHQVLKPIPLIPNGPVNVDELVGMSQLSLGEPSRNQREPSPISLKLIGEPSRQSAFHTKGPASVSDLNKRDNGCCPSRLKV